MRIPPVDEMSGQEATPKKRTKYFPSQSAESLLKQYSKLNPPTRLDHSHLTASSSADQMIQFARAVGLEMALVSYSMLEDMLLKAKGGSGAYPVTSRYPAGRSPFPSFAGSSMVDSVASRSVYSVPTFTETKGANVIVVGAQVVGDDLFETRLELFKVVLQDYREAFRRPSTVKRDQGFFLCTQMFDFLHRLLRRIISRDCLPEENAWDALSHSQFIEFCTKAMRAAAKRRINVKNERNKKSRTDVIATTVMGDIFNPHINQRRACIRYVCTELLKQSTFKSDVVEGLASFDYSVLVTLPTGQTMYGCARLFQSFCVRGWWAKNMKNVHMEICFEFINDLRFVHLNKLHIGPKNGGYGHVFVLKPRVVQTRIYFVCFQNVLFVFGARSTRAAEFVFGFT